MNIVDDIANDNIVENKKQAGEKNMPIDNKEEPKKILMRLHKMSYQMENIISGGNEEHKTKKKSMNEKERKISVM